MNEIATSKPFIDQIPKRDAVGVRYLEAQGYMVTIQWTSDGWRYAVGRRKIYYRKGRR